MLFLTTRSAGPRRGTRWSCRSPGSRRRSRSWSTPRARSTPALSGFPLSSGCATTPTCGRGGSTSVDEQDPPVPTAPRRGDGSPRPGSTGART
ncbi:hypothetical protein HBB16_18285 [Pseudonocardia sp. MCCB 268]|nr:hypothetical protein [Pseudonocardia cytotoxica]